RKYTGERISEKDLEKILQAGLASASGRNRKPWELVVVQDREMLEKLSHCRTGAAKMLEKAGCAILVFAGVVRRGVCTDACYIVVSNMHLRAASLGLGRSRIPGRLREAENGQTADAYCRERLQVHGSTRRPTRTAVNCSRFRMAMRWR